MATKASNRREKKTPISVLNQTSEAASKPSEDSIRILAFDLYQRRQADGMPGDAESDWVKAEKEFGAELVQEAD